MRFWVQGKCDPYENEFTGKIGDRGKMENSKAVQKKENEKGASMLEYALLAALIAVVCIAAVTLIGQDASTAFSRVASGL